MRPNLLNMRNHNAKLFNLQFNQVFKRYWSHLCDSLSGIK